MLSLSYCSIHSPHVWWCLYAQCVCICVWVYERHCTGFTTRVWIYYAFVLTCMRVCVCVLLLAPLQAHWRLSSHQDVPTGPSLGRVPGLSPACVLAECCQIIPHTWYVAWSWSYPPFTLNLPPPIPPRSPKTRLLDRLGQRSPKIPPAQPQHTLTLAFISCPSCVQHLTGLGMHPSC